VGARCDEIEFSHGGCEPGVFGDAGEGAVQDRSVLFGMIDLRLGVRQDFREIHMNVATRALITLWASLLALGVLAQNRVTPSISAGPTDGICYSLGGGIADVLSNLAPGNAANAETTAGSVANLQLMEQKKSDLGLSMAVEAARILRVEYGAG